MGLGKMEILSCALTLFRMLVSPWNKPVSRCIQGLVTQLWCGACPGRRCYYYRGEQDEDERWMWHRNGVKGGRRCMLGGLVCNLLRAQARPDVYAGKYLRGRGVIRSAVGRIPRSRVQELCWKAA